MKLEKIVIINYLELNFNIWYIICSQYMDYGYMCSMIEIFDEKLLN